MIISFDENWSMTFVRFNNTALLGKVTNENIEDYKLYSIRFDTGEWVGLTIIEPVENWADYRTLSFKVLSKNKNNIKMGLRIHDLHHNQKYSDRYNHTYIVRPGINEVEVTLTDVRDSPVKRKMDLSKIAEVELFLEKNNAPLHLALSGFLLKR